MENLTLSLDSSVEICSVRLSRSLRETLGVDGDTTIESVQDRPNRQFDIVSVSPPTNPESLTFEGLVCKIRAEQDRNTVFLRQEEHDAFGVPAGTTASITTLDTGKTIEDVTLGLDSDIAACVVRMSKPLREALGLADDTDIDPPSNRPGRQFSIRVPQP
jgi:hypothetical protein